MKIEDIKPGDVLCHSDHELIKVVEITDDGRIMISAMYSEKYKEFRFYLKPNRAPYAAVFCEPANAEQSQYVESKLSAFFAPTKADDTRSIASLSSIIADLKVENEDLTERVHQLTNDYNRVVRQLKGNPFLGDLTEALNKNEELNRKIELYKTECERLHEINKLLLALNDAQRQDLLNVQSTIGQH